MKKNIILGSIFALGLILMFGFVVASSHGPYELSEEAADVSTSNGVLDLPDGTMVGGDPSNYITLSAETTMETTSGTQTFQVATKIDCDHDIGEPDPCSG